MFDQRTITGGSQFKTSNMPRPAYSRLSPWIKSLILSYGSQEESSKGWLKAHVIGVGQMSHSQTRGTEGPTGLLFLSDGVLQIPAILTASAWEHLQEQEDRECFTSLVNTTVCIQDYQLQFHMALEHTKCKFILSVGELATTAAGPVKDSTPCSTTVPSIRLKICKTWKALLGQEMQDSQKSQCGFDLSELLGEWQHDCLQAVLEDVRERLMVASSCSVSMQPSTSSCSSSSHTFTATGWGVDRVSCKGSKCFSFSIKCLLMPEDDAQQQQPPPNVMSRIGGISAASEDGKRELLQVCILPETTQSSADDTEWQIGRSSVEERAQDANENSHCHVDTITMMFDCDIRPLSNPWDIFPPPLDSTSSSDTSQESTPTHSLHNPAAPQLKSHHSLILNSTQLPVHSSKETQQTSEHSKGEDNSLQPYQMLPYSAGFLATADLSTSVSPLEPFNRPSNLPTTDEHSTAKQYLPLYQEKQILEKDMKDASERKYRKAKRKRSEPTPEIPVEEKDVEEAQIIGSPPSWLFDTQTDSRIEEDCSHGQGQTVGTVSRKRHTVHSDGRRFSYSYQVSGQDLLDFSRFKVTESLLHWVVKYLVVPKRADNLHTTTHYNSQ